MKRLFHILILLMPFTLFSCFEFVGGTNMSKRMLNIAIAAPGDVAKLHIGVFDTVISAETMIYNQTVAAGSSIPLDLPTGINRIVLVWAEGHDGLANYYGSIGPIIIDESEDTTLPIQMKKFYTNGSTNAFNIQDIPGSNIGEIQWNSIPGAITYSLETDLTQITGETSIVPSRRIGTIRVLNSVFNIPSVSVPFNLT